MKSKTEDVIRTLAGEILEFADSEDYLSGVGQITTFNQLGFKGSSYKPDGWFLPYDNQEVAIILETKNSDVNISTEKIQDELIKNIKVANQKYQKVVGLIYNGEDIIIYKNDTYLRTESTLHSKDYYRALFLTNQIDTQKIYSLTKRINDTLHVDFGIKNLYHRMIFTACALVAKRYGANLYEDMTFNIFRSTIVDTLSKSYQSAIQINSKLNILLDVYSEIKMNATDNQNAINEFIKAITEISVNIISDFWNGEDVMAIFFNEFNRYKKKSEHGQVFTPDHITSLIYRILKVDKDDVVLDAACGSGAFLVKAMCNMINECGGLQSNQAKKIKESQLFGIEFDREIFALACANMLIHKDGKTNIEQMDARNEDAAKWIKSKPITKVLMNPPFENKYGCLDIVLNVLDSVKKNVNCAFIMPDNKLEMNKNKAKKILKKHRLLKIIKLPKEIFTGVTSSIFIFESNVPQNNHQIFSCNIAFDGLETVKNRGRHDIKNKWSDIEAYWVQIITKQSGDNSIQWLNPSEHLSYQIENKSQIISEFDFNKTIVDYLLFENKYDKKQLYEDIANCLLLKSKVEIQQNQFKVIIKES